MKEDGVQDLMKEWIAGNEPHIAKAAVLGVSGIKKLLYRVVAGGKKHIQLFDDKKAPWSGFSRIDTFVSQ